MSLAPILFDRRYADLVELGRSQLPALAPGWTDYNVHDPGIMLLELGAWVTEAQLYALGHMRRDERLAYSALFGVAPEGTKAARGILFSDRRDPSSPFVRYSGTRIIETDAKVSIDGHDEPLFHPERRILWAPGAVTRLQAQPAQGSATDLTAANDRGIAYFPFGTTAGPRDVLSLEFRTHSPEGLFPARRADADGAYWTLGIRADAPAVQAAADGAAGRAHAAAVAVDLVVDGSRYALRVEEDTTEGLLRTGVLVLDVSAVQGSPRSFRIELRSAAGFARPPRWVRIEPNVLPITQRQPVERELHPANGQADFGFDLDVPGLMFAHGAEAVRVEVAGQAGFAAWKRCEDLALMGPDDEVFEVDTAHARVRFGNGRNGKRPSAAAQVYASYDACSGASGNIAARRPWRVAGFEGVFGTNPDPVAGGADATGWDDIRRAVRRRAEDDHPLVTSQDVVDAARGLPLLEVARAWVAPGSASSPRTRTLTLVAMRARPGGIEPADPPETARWLAAVKRALAPRVPLGTRLQVVGPRYVDFSIRARVEVPQGRAPQDVADDVVAALRARLALVAAPGAERMPGVPLTPRDVGAWILAVDGVARITQLELRQGNAVVQVVKVTARGLPRLADGAVDVQATRATAGAP